MNRKTSSRLWILTTILAATTISNCEKSDISTFETVHNSNAAILNRLGLVPLRIPDGHHKKRLAGPEPSSDMMNVESTMSQTRLHQPYSRRHGHRDSHVYVVKLPPSQPYYTLTKPHKSSSLTASKKDNERVTTKTPATSIDSSPQVGFHGNGKPAKIYHWNLPIMKKMTEKKRLRAQLRVEQMRRRLIESETNDETSRERAKNQLLHQPMADRTAILPVTGKTPLAVIPTKPIVSESNTKRHHHLSSINSLNDNEKPIKHTRNNDKRLNYPRIPDELRKTGRPMIDENGKHPRRDNVKKNTVNKTYRLEDSNLYRLDSDYNNDKLTNDRLASWSLSNKLHASDNTPNSLRTKKHRKKSAMSYYAPIVNSRSNKIDASGTMSMQKNFPGNGKPKGFYVMEKSRQPVYYHPLLP